MLVFLIPLKAKASAADWTRVSRLCERTLMSACAQTCPDFRIILSCTDLPETGFTHPNLIIEQHEYPPVDRHCRQSQSLDKVLKLSRASGRAREFAPCHVMVLDADDLVSRRLAGFVDGLADPMSWRIDHGWLYQEGSRWIWRHRDLSSVCGSTHLVYCEPEDLPAAPEQGELLLTAHIPHTEITHELARRGREIRPLPFPGTIYSAAHGDNWSEGYMFQRRSWRTHLQRLSRMRPLTTRIRREFGLHPIETSLP